MPCRQGHGILSWPTVTAAVQRPDAIVREKGCRVVVILVVGVWRNDGKEHKKGAMPGVSEFRWLGAGGMKLFWVLVMPAGMRLTQSIAPASVVVAYAKRSLSK
jgi:hypothetical protein